MLARFETPPEGLMFVERRVEPLQMRRSLLVRPPAHVRMQCGFEAGPVSGFLMLQVPARRGVFFALGIPQSKPPLMAGGIYLSAPAPVMMSRKTSACSSVSA